MLKHIINLTEQYFNYLPEINIVLNRHTFYINKIIVSNIIFLSGIL